MDAACGKSYRATPAWSGSMPAHHRETTSEAAAPTSAHARWASQMIEAHRGKVLAAVLLVAAGVRGAVLVGLRDTAYWDFLLWDERTYDTWARHLVRGESHYVHGLSPLPAYLVAGVYRVFGADPLHFRIVNVLLGVGLCAVVFAIGRRIGGVGVGLGAALVCALYKPFVLFSVTLLKEPFGLLLFALVVLLSLQELERHHAGRAFLLGAVAGALTNVRQNAVVVLLVVAAAIVVRVARAAPLGRAALAALLLCAGFGVATAPFVLANHRGAGSASPAPLGGFDLYRGNSIDGPTPYYNPVPFSSPNPDTQGIEFTIEASRREGRRLTLAEASSYWTREVVREAARRPVAFGRKLLHKLLASLNSWEEADNHSLEFMGSFVPALRLAPFGLWLVMPLGLAGLVLLARRDRGCAVLLAMVLAYGATMVLVFPNMRIRAPLLVILIPSMVAGLAQVRAWRARGRRTVVAFAGLSLALLAIELVPVPGTRDLTAHYNTHAIALATRGRTEEALRFWETSSAMRGTYSAYADLALAGQAWMRGDLAAAERWLDRIPDSSFAAADKYHQRGLVLVAEGEREAALAALERALSVRPGSVETLQEAIDLYQALDPVRAGVLRQRLAEVNERLGAQR